MKPWLVLDNHTSHHTRIAKRAMENWFNVLYQPPYSSAFNCQETVWSVVKREYFCRMHRRDVELKTQLEYGQFLLEVCRDVPLNTINLHRANRKFIDQHLQLGGALNNPEELQQILEDSNEEGDTVWFSLSLSYKLILYFTKYSLYYSLLLITVAPVPSTSVR